MPSPFVFNIDREHQRVAVAFVNDREAYAIASLSAWNHRLEVRLHVGKDRRAGFIDLVPRDSREMEPGCFAASEQLRKIANRKTAYAKHAIYRVSETELHRAYHDRGYGVLMYAAAVVLAAMVGLGIACDECFDGTTSDDAARVWASHRFASIAYVKDGVAYLKRA